MLEQQQREREEDSFRHGCMFCSEEFTGNRCRAENGPILPSWRLEFGYYCCCFTFADVYVFKP